MTNDQLTYARSNPEDFVVALIKSRARLPLSRRETGLLIGCTKEKVRLIEDSALEKIRHAMIQEGIIEGTTERKSRKKAETKLGVCA